MPSSTAWAASSFACPRSLVSATSNRKSADSAFSMTARVGLDTVRATGFTMRRTRWKRMTGAPEYGRGPGTLLSVVRGDRVRLWTWAGLPMPRERPETTGVIPETRYAKTADGYHIAYQTLGDGPTDIVPVATYFSNIEHDWEEPGIAHRRRSFAEMGRLIVFDARGSGLSDRVTGDQLPTLEERIDDLRAVMDAVDSERVVLIAFADGGPLCCLFAATYPGRTKALVLNNTGSRTAWAPDYPWGMTDEAFARDLEATETRWGSREYAAEIVRENNPERGDDEALIDWWATLDAPVGESVGGRRAPAHVSRHGRAGRAAGDPRPDAGAGERSRRRGIGGDGAGRSPVRCSRASTARRPW